MKIKCDLLVVGAGAGGLSTAITAKKNGLDVVVIEKADVFGGSTAFSGGVLWIPGNSHGRKQNPGDSRAKARTYLQEETGDAFDPVACEAFLSKAPEMVEFFERETEVKFVPTRYPDYHPTVPGGVDVGRSILAKPFDIRGLGDNMKRLRPPLKTITFIGMMFNSSNADLKHFFNATKSLESFWYVTRRLATHIKELCFYGKGINVTSGNALAARLAKSAFDLNIPVHTSAAAKELMMEGDRVVGMVAEIDSKMTNIEASHGVVLACGGFAHDKARTAQVYPHLKRGGEHHSPVPESSTGDGLKMVEQLGVDIQCDFSSPAAWMPVSRVPLGGEKYGVFPHLLDRYKPGVIGINPQGKRFCNESESYHDVGAAMVEYSRNQQEQTYMWLICDQTCMDKYGLGFAKPAPMPKASLIKSGYLIKAKTLEALAAKLSVDAKTLISTVEEYNTGATQGVDQQFQRGETAFNRFLADPENKPNPCVAPVTKGSFYAVKVFMGDLGTFDGIKTSVYGEVLQNDGQPVPGLYAVGNDRKSIMGGNYPAAGITLGPIMTFGYITGRRIAGIDDQLVSGEVCDEALS